MIRRPLTEIALKFEDIQDYENYRREQTNNSLASSKMQEDTPKSLSLAGGTKTAEGFAPTKKPRDPSAA